MVGKAFLQLPGMAPEHLKAKSFWERRCVLLEGLVFQIIEDALPALTTEQKQKLVCAFDDWRSEYEGLVDEFDEPLRKTLTALNIK